MPSACTKKTPLMSVRDSPGASDSSGPATSHCVRPDASGKFAAACAVYEPLASSCSASVLSPEMTEAAMRGLNGIA